MDEVFIDFLEMVYVEYFCFEEILIVLSPNGKDINVFDLVTLLKETTVVGQNNFAEWLMVDVK
jgi:hypothetical protein